MTDFQMIIAVVGIMNTVVFGSLYKVLRDGKLDASKALDIAHKRISDAKKGVEIAEKEVARMELELERGKNECLKAVLDAKTETDAKIDASRSEFTGTITNAVNKTDARLDRFESRMMTHDDAAIHFSRLEEGLGKLTSSVEEILHTLPRFDERIKNLEKV